jgi:hypothetical protein
MCIRRGRVPGLTALDGDRIVDGFAAGGLDGEEIGADREGVIRERGREGLAERGILVEPTIASGGSVARLRRPSPRR